jgi:hypothetical protein
MKKLTIKSMGLFLTIGLCLMSARISAQETKLTGQEQKEATRNIMLANYKLLDSLVTGKNFVLKADFLENQYGERIIALPMVNFIRIDPENAVLQTGNNASIGYNGVGGVTAEGKIISWKLMRDEKNLTFFIQFSVLTSTGSYQVAMRIDSNNNAQATITGLTRGRLTYDGHLETINDLRIYKGQGV